MCITTKLSNFTILYGENVMVYIALDKIVSWLIDFFYFSTKTYVLGTH